MPVKVSVLLMLDTFMLLEPKVMLFAVVEVEVNDKHVREPDDMFKLTLSKTTGLVVVNAPLNTML